MEFLKDSKFLAALIILVTLAGLGYAISENKMSVTSAMIVFGGALLAVSTIFGGGTGTVGKVASGVSGFVSRVFGSVITMILFVVVLTAIAITVAIMAPAFWGHIAGVAAPLTTAFLMALAAGLLRKGVDKDAFVRFAFAAAWFIAGAVAIHFLWAGKTVQFQAWFDGNAFSYRPTPVEVKKGRYAYVVRGDAWTLVRSDGTYGGKIGAEGDPTNGYAGEVVLFDSAGNQLGTGTQGTFELAAADTLSIKVRGSNVLRAHYFVEVSPEKGTAKEWFLGTDTPPTINVKKLPGPEKLQQIAWQGRSMFLTVFVLAALLGVTAWATTKIHNALLQKGLWTVMAEVIIIGLYHGGMGPWVNRMIGGWLGQYGLTPLPVLMALVAVCGLFSLGGGVAGGEHGEGPMGWIGKAIGILILAFLVAHIFGFRPASLFASAPTRVTYSAPAPKPAPAPLNLGKAVPSMTPTNSDVLTVVVSAHLTPLQQPGMKVEKGDVLKVVSVSGKWATGTHPSTECDASGHGRSDNLGRLIAVIDRGGKKEPVTITVGGQTFVKIPEDGALHFAMADAPSRYGDNSGAITIRFQHVTSRSAPPYAEVPTDPEFEPTE